MHFDGLLWVAIWGNFTRVRVQVWLYMQRRSPWLNVLKKDRWPRGYNVACMFHFECKCAIQCKCASVLFASSEDFHTIGFVRPYMRRSTHITCIFFKACMRMNCIAGPLPPQSRNHFAATVMVCTASSPTCIRIRRLLADFVSWPSTWFKNNKVCGKASFLLTTAFHDEN